MPLERDDPSGFRNGGVEGDGNLSPAALAGLFMLVGVGQEAGDGGEQEGAETALGGVGLAQPFFFQEASEEGLGQVLGGFGRIPGQSYQSYLVASNAAGIRSTPMLSFRTGISQVSNLGDAGLGSLRSVVDHAPAGTVIDLRGLSGVVTLTQGPLRVERDVTLVGPGAKVLAVSGGGVQALLENHATLEISGLTLREGVSARGGRDGTFAPVVNHGNLNLTECAVVQNQCRGFSYGPIINYASGRLRFTRCTLSGNQSTEGAGGAVNNQFGSVVLRQCTLSDNIAPEGGAIRTLEGSVDLIECTLAGNLAISGGAIQVDAPTVPAPVASLRLRNCLVAGNRAATGPDIRGRVTSNGNNLIGIWDQNEPWVNTSGQPDRVGTPAAPLDARLLPLADNGGPTLTMALQTNSPAIDVGSSVPEPGVDGFDQRGRGYARRSGFGVDVGAFELQVPDPVAPAIRIDVPPPGAVPGLYLSWPSTLVGGQPVVWPLFRNTGLQPAVPWVRVESSKVVWNPDTRRWYFDTPKLSETEFFRLGNP